MRSAITAGWKGSASVLLWGRYQGVLKQAVYAVMCTEAGSVFGLRSKVSVPVEKAIGLMEWVQSLGHIVPELQELNSLKKRCTCSLVR